MKFVKSAALLLGLMFAAAAPAAAQGPVNTTGYTAKDATEAASIAYAGSYKAPFSDLRGVAAGLIIIGAAMGIGMLAKSAVESMARQPEVAGQINTSMIIAAALIEGVTFFALIIVILQRAY